MMLGNNQPQGSYWLVVMFKNGKNQQLRKLPAINLLIQTANNQMANDDW